MELLDMIQAMKHSPVRNYAVPGLTSWLIGGRSDCGTVRLFECDRDHQEPITPHSHRFDFHCLVLAGEVMNIIWTPEEDPTNYYGFPDPGKDRYTACTQEFINMGMYKFHRGDDSRYKRTNHYYKEGDQYSMKMDQIHSIFFGAGAKVLFFEGPQITNNSVILQPFVDGEVIDTFKVEPWMFKRAAR